MTNIANFCFDNRGFSLLYQHALKMINSGKIDSHCKVLDLTGTKIRTISDTQYLRKILELFNPIRVCLGSMGMSDCKSFMALLDNNVWWRTQKIDISENAIAIQEIQRLVVVLKKHCLEERKSFFLAVGDKHPSLLVGSCGQYGGCR